jgi:hypothetical protein
MDLEMYEQTKKDIVKRNYIWPIIYGLDYKTWHFLLLHIDLK